MVATFALGLAYTWLYLRGYNLIALGIYHGWLGGVFFYTVLGRNSYLEAFG
jgi:ABC-type Mn2+/Zn2+ transport system permease subunit